MAAALSALLAAALLAACGGGGDGETARPGNLTDPREVPTEPPWSQPPEVHIIDPNAIGPLPPTEPRVSEPGEGGEPRETGGEPGVCGETYTVVAGDTFDGIAAKCGVTREELQAANPDIEDIRSLSIGQVLNIPPPSSEE
jgi:hypothetical protein